MSLSNFDPFQRVLCVEHEKLRQKQTRAGLPSPHPNMFYAGLRRCTTSSSTTIASGAGACTVCGVGTCIVCGTGIMIHHYE